MDLHVFDFLLPFCIVMLVTLDSCIPFRFFCSFLGDILLWEVAFGSSRAYLL
jgi:hypothetical protein